MGRYRLHGNRATFCPGLNCGNGVSEIVRIDRVGGHDGRRSTGPGDSRHYFATEKRDYMADRMTPEQIAEAQRLAREWKPTE